jgi:hypothetical protein
MSFQLGNLNDLGCSDQAKPRGTLTGSMQPGSGLGFRVVGCGRYGRPASSEGLRCGVLVYPRKCGCQDLLVSLMGRLNQNAQSP